MKQNRAITLAILTACLLMGFIVWCATLPSALEAKSTRIRAGMSLGEVVQIMESAPTDLEDDDLTPQVRYATWKNSSGSVVVSFRENGTVVDTLSGRCVSFTPRRPEGLWQIIRKRLGY